jgi:thiamine-phosphate diphosphorylase
MGIYVKDPLQQRNEVLYRLELAVTHLEASLNPVLIEDGQARLAFAISGARDGDDVAAVPGGVALLNGKVTRCAPCAFGADENAARIVLTAIKCDPLMRSAAIIRFSEKVLAVFEAMLLECTPIHSTSNAPAISTMDWGVASCCNDGVPDVMYDCAGKEKPRLLYIFGEEPLVVANNIIICSNRI